MKRYIISSEKPKSYRRYVIQITPYKQDKWKVYVIDNHFDKDDFAFYNPEDGQLYSYSDVATNFVKKVVDAIDGSGNTISLDSKGTYGVHTDGPYGDVVKVEPYHYKVTR